MKLKAPLMVSLTLVLAALVLLSPAAGASAVGACPNEQVRSETHSASLPDCRAYEMVSPVYKEGALVHPLFLGESGSRLIGESFGTFAGAEHNVSLPGEYYSFGRTGVGWSGVAAGPPASLFSGTEYLAILKGTDREADKAVWTLGVSAIGRSPTYLYSREGGGPFVPIGPEQESNATTSQQGEYAGASDDLTKVLFQLFSDNPSRGIESSDLLWPGDTTIDGSQPSLYAYSSPGQREPELVGVSNERHLDSNSEADLITQCGTVLGSGLEGTMYNAVSARGQDVFFTARPGGCVFSGAGHATETGSGPPSAELYARVNATTTVPISVPSATDCSGACAAASPRRSVFQGASESGERVFFTTPQTLLNEDHDGTADLYEAILRNGVVTNLVMVSRGGAGDPTPGEGAEVLGVSRVSEDGSHVYFVASGVLTGPNTESRAPALSANNLYVSDTETGTTTFIATLSGEDEADWQPQDVRPFQVTPSGQFAVFTSVAEPGQEHTGASKQVYEYDAALQRLTRISIGQNGFNNNGLTPSLEEAAVVGAPKFYRTAAHSEQFTSLAVSADGQYVAFEAKEALTPLAVEGFNNVYEYHAGQVELVSDGQDVGIPSVTGLGGGSQLLAIDESGGDVFFTTTDQLVAQDTDTQRDIYDARVDGGFPAPVSTGGCGGEECQGRSSSPPQLPNPASASAIAEDGIAPSLVAPATRRLVKSPTRAQKLAEALKACRKSTSKKLRASCERSARGRYGAIKPKKAKARKATSDRRAGR